MEPVQASSATKEAVSATTGACPQSPATNREEAAEGTMLVLKLWERTREEEALPGLFSMYVMLLRASQEHV